MSPAADALAFVVIKPDAVLQGLDTAICAYLAERNLRILRLKRHRLSSADRRRMYRDHVVNGRTNWNLGARLYRLAPCVFVIVGGEYPPAARSLSEYITGLKGSFIPDLADASSIRAAHNAVNPVFNLLHTASTTAEAVEQMRIFFAAREIPQDPAREPVIDWPARLARGRAPTMRFDFHALLCDIKRRVAEASPVACRSSEYFAFLQDMRAAIQQTPRSEQRRRVIEWLHREQAVLAAWSERDPAAHLLEHLARPAEFQSISYPALFRRLARLGVTLPAWDKYLLQTSLYYLPSRWEEAPPGQE